MTRLVLASASPARYRLLAAAGFAPDVEVSGVDEDGVTGPPEVVALELARRKAEAVADRLDGAHALVVGCDSVLDVDGEIRGKPTDLDQARAWWRSVAGRTAVLRTGHHVVDVASGQAIGAVAATTVRYGTPSDAEMDAYLASGEPLGVAGGFTIDGRSAPFVESIDGDPGTVVGLSLPLLRRLVVDLGHRLVDLWVP